MTIDLSWSVVVALAVLLTLAVGVHALARTGLTRDTLVAATRSVLQLGAAALVITAAIQHLWTSLLVILIMFAMAVVTTCRRVGASLAAMPYAACAIAAGVVPVLAVLVASGSVPWSGIALIPIAGILLGNSMTAHTLFARRAFSALRDEHGGYEALLSLGMLPREAVAEIVQRYVPEGLVVGLDQIRTAGVVTLPGAFIGVMLGGGTPAQAATAQVMVLFGLMAAQSIAVVVESRLVARRVLLTPGLQRALID